MAAMCDRKVEDDKSKSSKFEFHRMKSYLIDPRARCVATGIRGNCGGLPLCPQWPCLIDKSDENMTVRLTVTAAKLFYLLSLSVKCSYSKK